MNDYRRGVGVGGGRASSEEIKLTGGVLYASVGTQQTRFLSHILGLERIGSDAALLKEPGTTLINGNPLQSGEDIFTLINIYIYIFNGKKAKKLKNRGKKLKSGQAHDRKVAREPQGENRKYAPSLPSNYIVGSVWAYTRKSTAEV